MSMERFRAMHRPGEPLVLPNAWDHASAVALLEAGFDVIGTTSLGVAAAYGLPDARGLARAETVALARRLAGLPLLFTVDIEGGFSSDPSEVADLAAELARLGAVGVNLEDGRPGRTLAGVRAQCELIAAVKARVPDLFLNARIDTYWTGTEQDTTLERAGQYIAAGADGIFVPAVVEEPEIRMLATELAVPLNVLYAPGGPSVRELAGCGVSRISTGSLLFRTAIDAAAAAASAIRDDESPGAGVTGYAEFERRLERYGAGAEEIQTA